TIKSKNKFDLKIWETTVEVFQVILSALSFSENCKGRKDLVKDKPKEIKIDNEIIGKARYESSQEEQ
ncbi:MAG TPA: hypothetical protein PLS50_08325, partial [Candidatus Dojkabacteria bacterium]|nr:hypothetical protein [Candidatus Dojkabacteria bacterium]